MTEDIKSVAGRVLSTGQATEAEIRRLAGYVVGDYDDRRTSDPVPAIDIPGEHPA